MLPCTWSFTRAVKVTLIIFRPRSRLPRPPSKQRLRRPVPAAPARRPRPLPAALQQRAAGFLSRRGRRQLPRRRRAQARLGRGRLHGPAPAQRDGLAGADLGRPLRAAGLEPVRPQARLPPSLGTPAVGFVGPLSGSVSRKQTAFQLWFLGVICLSVTPLLPPAFVHFHHRLSLHTRDCVF